jgi:TatD DNase family protein
MNFTDTHCHIHSLGYGEPSIKLSTAIQNAKLAGVTKLICVGCNEKDSQLAVDFASKHGNIWASVGLHPHDTKRGQPALNKLASLCINPNVVAVGECGLDYFYNHSGKQDQAKALHFQIQLAIEHNLPMIFHVRDAFDDFWPIFDQYQGVRGVVHSFTASRNQLEQCLARGLYIGLNGIITFTKNSSQLEVAKTIPLQKLLLETDAPFLTPIPLRGTVNEPRNMVLTADFLAKLRLDSRLEIANQTTANAQTLFGI